MLHFLKHIAALTGLMGDMPSAWHLQVDVTLLHQGGAIEEPAADENRFELVLKKLKGIAVGSFGILQLPISFKALSLEESSGEVQVLMEAASVSSLDISEPLLWRYPIKVGMPACSHANHHSN